MQIIDNVRLYADLLQAREEKDEASVLFVGVSERQRAAITNDLENAYKLINIYSIATKQEALTLAVATEQRPEIAFIHYSLPDGTGIETIQALKKNDSALYCVLMVPIDANKRLEGEVLQAIDDYILTIEDHTVCNTVNFVLTRYRQFRSQYRSSKEVQNHIEQLHNMLDDANDLIIPGLYLQTAQGLTYTTKRIMGFNFFSFK